MKHGITNEYCELLTICLELLLTKKAKFRIVETIPKVVFGKLSPQQIKEISAKVCLKQNGSQN